MRIVQCVVAAFLLFAVGARPASAQAWPGYARDAQHTSLGVGPSQLPQRIRWSIPVDQNPQYSGSELLIHYGSPLITRINTVIVPVKTGATGGFQVSALRASDGGQLWMVASDYAVPPYHWFPEFGVTLTPKDATLVIPAAGGTVLVRNFPDSPNGTTTRTAFYGIANYNANPAAFNSAIQICTPISSDRLGNLFFGFVSTGAALPGYPSGIPSGLARISSRGVASFVSAVAISGDSNMVKVVYNVAPAFSNDGNSLYVAVNNVAVSQIGAFGLGYLCRLDSTTLAKQSSIFLTDPRSTQASPLSALISDDGSETPTVGPDSDVYFGVLEGNFGSNHARGWLLHYSADLATTKLASAFGWDDTASVVPASIVPSYSGPSRYLLLTKYNNYVGGGGDGVNKLAVVDPNVSMIDPVTGATVMNTVITITGPTPDMTVDRNQFPNAVREWCINSAAIDPVQKCAVVNNEDGHVYRWDFTTNTLTSALNLEPPTAEAYTPTIMGPDGAVYAVNNATLFSCVHN
jgi:hypothetical protein